MVYDIKFRQNFLEYFYNNLRDNLEYRSAYYYILGQYLGDGCISETKNKRTLKLRIACCDKYPGIISELTEKFNIVFPANSVIKIKNLGCFEIAVYNKFLPSIFPQHGSGEKHNRKIELSELQEKYICYKELARGLFHSDGSYYPTKDKSGKIHHFYNFTNCSEDIHNIFKRCLESENIYSRRNIKTIDKCYTPAWVTTISRTAQVELAYNFLGHKT